ncbi:hypothetical protein ACO2Q3_16920 [Caulobacter sp. KR2-114]|uniref:hypothetical protein n=1 Tax=Caulobacter sp. KR2-114 TaxID=3400912 RepID=UPI003C099785
MPGPIDPIQRAAAARRAHRQMRERERAEAGEEIANLPVPISDPVEPPPPEPPASAAAAAYAAHLLGQSGQKRGLKGGPATLESARSAYLGAEWSGPADRRAGKGKVTKTEI